MAMTSTERSRKLREGLTDEARAAKREADAERKRFARAAMTAEQRRASRGVRGSAGDRDGQRARAFERETGEPYIPMHARPFVGVDGEGGAWAVVHGPDCSGGLPCDCGRAHRYAFLTVGDRTLRNADGAPLTTEQCFEFLLSQPRCAHYVAYYFDYDVTHLLYDLNDETLRAVIARDYDEDAGERCVWWKAPSGRRYGIDYIPRKYITITVAGDVLYGNDGHVVWETKDGKRRPKRGRGRSITVFDTSGYWQSSFVKALDDWQVGSAADRERVRRGKAGRSAFDIASMAADIDACPAEHTHDNDDGSCVLCYNLTETRLLAELVGKLNDAAQHVGIRLRRFNGAGTLAQALMERWQTPAYRTPHEELNPGIVRAITVAFGGGRFETSAVGRVETCFELDIASAYPAALLTMPCLAHGRWTWRSKRWLKEHGIPEHSVCEVSWSVPQTAEMPFAPFQYRTVEGALYYPTHGRTWAYSWEVEAARDVWRERGGTVVVHEAWQWVQECDHRPFAGVADLYAERLRLGKQGPGKVLKLGLNSLFGKTAQTIGGGSRYSEYIWAGMVTSQTRAKLYRLAALGGRHTLMLATDGVFFDAMPEGVETFAENPPLGSWEHHPVKGVHHDVLIVQPGVYFDHERVSKNRTRGISTALLDATNGYARLYDAWDAFLDEFAVAETPAERDRAWRHAAVPFGEAQAVEGRAVPRLFVGIRSALHRGRRDHLGQWLPLSKVVSFDPRGRRIVGSREGGLVRTLPPHFGGDWDFSASAPYRKMARNAFAAGDAWLAEQPDRVDPVAMLAEPGEFTEDV